MCISRSYFDDHPTNIAAETLVYVVTIYGLNNYTFRKAFLKKYSAWKYIENYYNEFLKMSENHQDFNIECVKLKTAPSVAIVIQLSDDYLILITMECVELSFT